MKRLVLIGLVLCISLATHAQNWGSLDAVVYNNKEDQYFFFYGKNFVIKQRGQYIDGMPLVITEEWENFPKSWGGGNLDAVCYSPDNDKYYFFKGDEVAETTVAKVNLMGMGSTIKFSTQRLAKPVKISSKDGFPGIPWPSIDAATYNSETKTYYFFKGNEFVSKKRGEPVDSKIRKTGIDAFKNIDAKRPLKAVDYSGDNEAYYFYWDEFYMIKEQGEDIKANSQRRYEGDGQKGFEWAERGDNNFVGLANEAGYVANFRVTWKSGNKTDSWTKKGAALTYEKRLALPKNATEITITAWVHDALKDDKNGKRIFSSDMNIPPNRWYKVYGTVFDPKHKAEKKSTNIMGSIQTFVTKDVANAVSDAGQFFEDNFNEAQNNAVKLLAKAEADKRKAFIEAFGKEAIEVVKDQKLITDLFEVAKAKDVNKAKDVMKTLANHPAWKEVKKALEFKSMSVGFTSGASNVIGMEGSFGYGVALKSPNATKGYAGLDASLGVQSGAGLGCQFGLWKNPPDQLSGNSVAVNVEVGAGAGVSFSIVYDVTFYEDKAPEFSFGGIVVTPGLGAGVGGSVGTGYSWVF